MAKGKYGPATLEIIEMCRISQKIGFGRLPNVAYRLGVAVDTFLRLVPEAEILRISDNLRILAVGTDFEETYFAILKDIQRANDGIAGLHHRSMITDAALALGCKHLCAPESSWEIGDYNILMAPWLAVTENYNDWRKPPPRELEF